MATPHPIRFGLCTLLLSASVDKSANRINTSVSPDSVSTLEFHTGALRIALAQMACLYLRSSICANPAPAGAGATELLLDGGVVARALPPLGSLSPKLPPLARLSAGSVSQPSSRLLKACVST